jgi:hypothetical protein
MESRFSPDELTAPEARQEPEPLATEEHPASATRELVRGRDTRTVLAMVSLWFLWYIGNYRFLGDAPSLFSANGLGRRSPCPRTFHF